MWGKSNRIKINDALKNELQIGGHWSTALFVAVNIAFVFFLGFISLKFPSSTNIFSDVLFWLAGASYLAVLLLLIPLSINYHHWTKSIILDMKNHIDDTKNRHITLTEFSKEIIISDEVLSSGNTILHHRMKLFNHHKSSYYDNYLYSLESAEGISKYNDYIFCINGNISKISEDNFTYYTKTREISKDEEDTQNGCLINIHVGIPGNKSGLLEIIEPKCPCFKSLNDAKNGDPIIESLALMVYYPTEVLRMAVRLDDKLKGYSLKTGALCPDKSDTGSCDFKVIDKSNQRIEQYEIKLQEWGAVPEYSRDGRKIVWEIHTPKVGYRYHLPFALVKNSQNRCENPCELLTNSKDTDTISIQCSETES